MKIGNFDLQHAERPFLVAEAGASHNGNPDEALALARAAVDAGADALTFQEIDEQLLFADLPERPVLPMPRVGWDCLRECRDIARESELAFSVCVTDLPSLEQALALDIDFVKIVSYDITCDPFLEACGKTGRPVFMSTGASLFSEVQHALDVLSAPGRVVLYHTDCGYPTPPEEINLARMRRLAEVFGVPSGYCDHTADGVSCTAAAALGAAVIEKHVSVSFTEKTPDHMVALSPDGLKELFDRIRDVARMRGTGADEIAECDRFRRENLRRSIALGRDIKAGTAIREDDLIMLRPPTGLAWNERDQLIGRRAARDLSFRQLIRPDDVAPGGRE